MKISSRQKQIAFIDSKLSQFLPSITMEPKKLHNAMRYAVLADGKRLRPLLVLQVGTALGAKEELLAIAACAIEYIHTYSLIHDDLPAMDNDDWRRGKPSCHKAFDEATAILAGDALFNLAIQLIVDNSDLFTEVMGIEVIKVLTHACGSFGMVGGQAIELEFTTKPALAHLEHIHNLKTGALFRAALKIGALIGKANDEQLTLLDNYGKCLGLMFQIKDDILDKELQMNEVKTRVGELHKQAQEYLVKLTPRIPFLADLLKEVL